MGLYGPTGIELGFRGLFQPDKLGSPIFVGSGWADPKPRSTTSDKLL